jgi:hypothetical protein
VPGYREPPKRPMSDNAMSQEVGRLALTCGFHGRVRIQLAKLGRIACLCLYRRTRRGNPPEEDQPEDSKWRACWEREISFSSEPQFILFSTVNSGRV